MESTLVVQLQERLRIELGLARTVLASARAGTSDVTAQAWEEAAVELANVVLAHGDILTPMLGVLDEVFAEEIADLDLN